MELDNYLYLFLESCDYFEIKRLIEVNHFDISKQSLEEISFSNISGSYGFSSDVRGIDFLEDGMEDLIATHYPFSDRHYDYVDFASDHSQKELKLGELNKSLCDPKEAIIVEQKPLLLGDYSEIYSEKDIRYKKYGLNHEVIVLDNNKVISRGSNANKQLDFNHYIVDEDHIECGNHYTAVLSRGRVSVFGYLGNINHEFPFNTSIKPPRDLELRPEDLNSPIKVGNPVEIKLERSKYNIYCNDLFIGTLKSNTRHKNKYIKFVLSFLKPEIISIVDDIDKLVDKTGQNIEIGFFSITKDILKKYGVEYLDVSEWNMVTNIYPIENGLLGETVDSKFVFYGEVNNILLLVALLDKEVKKHV